MRIPGAIAILGGVLWLVKVAIIWGDGGAGATEGVPGLLFLAGAIVLAIAGALGAWQISHRLAVPWRVLLLLAALVALVALVNLPILVGWQIFGHVWLAEEVGVVLTAVLAIGFGIWWVFAGPPASRSPRNRGDQ